MDSTFKGGVGIPLDDVFGKKEHRSKEIFTPAVIEQGRKIPPSVDSVHLQIPLLYPKRDTINAQRLLASVDDKSNVVIMQR